MIHAPEIRIGRWLPYIIYLIIFFTLSVQYKVDNFPAVRPLYVYGLLMIATLWLVASLRYNIINILLNGWGRGGAIIAVALLVYLFFHAIIAGERQLKDGFYFSYTILLIPSVFLLYAKHFNAQYSILVFARSIIFFSVISSIIAILVFFGMLQYEGEIYRLTQNNWTQFRLHGYMGQPTAFGALVGFSLILVKYLSSLGLIRYRLLINIFLIFALIGSGSRSAIIALITAYLFFYINSPKKIVIFVSTVLLISSLVFITYLLLLQYEVFDISFLNSLERYTWDTDSENSRIFIWSTVISYIYGSEDILALVFGHGSSHLELTYHAAFNTPLQITYNYGIFGLLLFLSSIFASFYLGWRRFAVSKLMVYRLGLMLLAYGFIFNMFVSSFLSPFFHFQVLAIVIGILILNLPISFFNRGGLNLSK